MGWTYDPVTHRYRAPDGTPLTRRASVGLRDAFAAARAQIAREIAVQYTSGALNRLEFAAALTRFIEETLVASYLFGRGGINAALLSDAERMHHLIADQLGFGAEFLAAIDREGLSPDQIAARAALYADAAVYAYEEARGTANGIALPFYPADHQTSCRGSCRCWWVITSLPGGGRQAVYHTAGDDRVCDDCAARGRQYGPGSPYVQGGVPA